MLKGSDENMRQCPGRKGLNLTARLVDGSLCAKSIVATGLQVRLFRIWI